MGSLLPALFVSAVGYCLPALLCLSGMAGGIEWLGFWPLFHAAALLSLPYGWLAPVLLGAAAAVGAGLMADLDFRYEHKGLASAL